MYIEKLSYLFAMSWQLDIYFVHKYFKQCLVI